MASFREKWLAAVEQKNSVLCAGLDPAEYDLGREEEGLPDLVDKREWSFRYLEDVAPYAAALKINVNYWKDRDDMRTAEELADNEAAIFYAKKKGFDAITIATFAGNLEAAAEQARRWDIGLISMCLMSNPE